MKIVFLHSHPIQYFAPLYQELSKDTNIDLQVWYCSDESIKGHDDLQFGVKVNWDIPLLKGYSYQFFKNNSWKPSVSNGFWGLMNFSLVKALKEEPNSLVVVHGWKFFSYVYAIIAAHYFGHKVCLRLETPLSHEKLRIGLKSGIRRFIMKRILFPRIHKFFYIGKGNMDFFLHHGINQNKLIFTPYSIDNKRFRKIYLKNKNRKDEIRTSLGLPIDKQIIISSGKYIDKKNPMDIIRAFAMINQADIALVMVGEGILRPQMESLIKGLNLKNVYLTGFINQSKIPHYYSVADIFVMASGLGETWGLSTNEAMNFGLPVVLYELTGCSQDLVKDGKNGFVIPNGNIEELSDKLALLTNDHSFRQTAGQLSLSIIDQYSYATVIENLNEVFN